MAYPSNASYLASALAIPFVFDVILSAAPLGAESKDPYRYHSAGRLNFDFALAFDFAVILSAAPLRRGVEGPLLIPRTLPREIPPSPQGEENNPGHMS